MEDALRGYSFRFLSDEEIKVLILILMEDALRAQRHLIISVHGRS